MLLQVVSLAHDIRGDGLASRKLYTRNLTLGRVGFLGLADVDLLNDALALITLLERRRLGQFGLLPRFASDRLVEREPPLLLHAC